MKYKRKNPYNKTKNRTNITKWPIHENEAKRINAIETKPKDIYAKLNYTLDQTFEIPFILLVTMHCSAVNQRPH
jgi:hypothetical protein